MRTASKFFAVCLLLAAAMLPAWAQTVSTLPNFAQRYTTNASGDIRIVGNTILTCTGAACTSTVLDGTSATNLNNNSQTSANLDVDTTDPGLTTGTYTSNNSSSADFSLPVGASILRAYLYWYGESPSTNADAATARGRVKLRTSPGGSYTTVTASNIYQQAAPAAGIGYASVADVTSVVSNVSTTFTVAGMVTQPGVTDTYAGWSLVLVLADPAQPFRKLTVFDGLKQVGSGAPQTINLSLGTNATPPAGAVSMRMGVIAGEGDRGTVGDAVAVRSYSSSGASPNAYTTLPNDAGATDNFFNSSITRLNANIAAKNPHYINNLGVDMDVFDVPNAGNSVVQNSTNALDINLTSTGDVYLPSVVTTAVQLYVPNVQQDMVKTVVDLNGGDVQPGDVLEYTIAFSNTGGDFADATVLNDPIPANTTYVPGSLTTAVGPATVGGVLTDVARSDAVGDDVAEYHATGCPSFNAAPCVRARLGTGATAAAGGAVSPGGPTAVNSQVRFKFRVQVNPGIPAGTAVTNIASVTYMARTLGTIYTVTSPAATVTNGPANLRLTKTHVGDFSQGQSNAAYTLTVTNDGGVTTAPFTVTDTLPAGLSFVSGTGANWTCSAVGPTVTCQNSNAAPLNLGGSSTITLLVNVAPTAASSVTNTASVSGGGESAATTGNNSASDPTTIQGAPDLTITKVHSGNFNVSQTGRTYTVTVTNAGTALTSGTVSVVDNPPAGMTVTALAGTGWTCTLATRTCTRSDALGAAQSYPAITVTATMPSASGTYDQVAVVSGGGEFYAANNTATDPTLVLAASLDFGVTKTHSGNFYQGQVGAAYSIVVTNTSGSNSGGGAQFTVVDTPPAGLTITAMSGSGWTCTVATATCTRSSASSLNGGLSHPPIAVTVNVSPTAASSVTNIVTMTPSGVSGDANAANNTASDVTVIEPRIDLSLTKTASTATPVQGVPFTYTLTASNSSMNNATGVSVLDVLPAGLSFVSATPSQGTFNAGNGVWSVGAIAAGGNATLTLNVTPTVTGAIANTAEVLAADQLDADSTPNNQATVPGEDDTASVSVTVTPSPVLTVSKTTSTPNVVNTSAGATATYTLTIANSSTVAANGVTVTDTLPAGFAFGSTGSVTLNGVALTPAQYAVGGSAGVPLWDRNPSGGFTVNAGQSLVIVFNATLAPSVADGSYNNSASATSSSVGVQITPFDGAVNTSDNVTVTSAVLATSKTTSTPVVSMGSTGGAATYTVTVSNSGTGPATGVKLTDTLPAGFTYGSTTSFALNGSALAASAYQVHTSGSQTAATPQWDSNPTAGFTINAGQSLVLVFTANIAAGTPDDSYNNSALPSGLARSIAGYNGDLVANSSENVTLAGAILSTIKSTSTPVVAMGVAGATATYTLTVSNSGTAAATGVTVTDALPPGFSLASTTSVTLNGAALAASAYQATGGGGAPQWTSNPAGGFTINPGQSLVIVFNAAVATSVADGLYDNSAITAASGPVRSLSSFDGAANTGDDVEITSANLAVSKSTSTPSVTLSGGSGTATYSITVRNTGSAAATGVRVEDSPLPLGFAYANTTSVMLNGVMLAPSAYQVHTNGAFTVANPQWDSLPGGGFTINPGQSLAIVFNATIHASVASGTYNNNAMASGMARTIANYNGALAGNGFEDVTVIAGVNVSGRVYADANHNAQRDANESGTGLTLYAKLLPASSPAGPASQVVSVAAVSGAYSFASVPAGTYSIVIDNNASAADVTPTLPIGWLGTEMPDSWRANVVVTTVELQEQHFGLFNGSKLSGRVFADNGSGTGTPNDGLQNGAEAGLAGVWMRATDASGSTVWDSAQTQGAGDYTLWIPMPAANGSVRVVQSNLAGQRSTGGAPGNTGGTYTRATDTVSFTSASGSIYSGVNFADVRDNALAGNGQQTTAPGNVVFYAHRFVPGSGGAVSFALAAVASPGTALGFSQVLHHDLDCNGELDAGEPVQSGALTALADVPICVIVKESVPGAAPIGASNTVTLAASFSYTNASPALASSHSNTDITTVGAAGALVLVKSQSSGSVAPGAQITYTVEYRNQSATALSNIVLADATPTFTRHVSAACVLPLPSGISACTVTSQPAAGATGSIAWTLAGSLAAGARGQVQFTVQVNP
jgi:uncharacterized repeat protein (TIGR01451 family)